jgi:hypothetical protein
MTQPAAGRSGKDTPDSAAADDRSRADKPLAETRMGDEESGGLAGQGGMRDPEKTSDPDPQKPS